MSAPRRPTRPSSGSRCTSSSRRAPRCSAAARRPSARRPTPRPARSAWACRARCRDQPPGRRVRHCARRSRSAAASTPACRFARKHYFYPDMPKNYQISQYEEPLAEDGALEIDLADGARAHRHRAPAPRGGRGQAHPRGRRSRPRRRAWSTSTASGVPLMEIVSRPDLRSPEEAAAYLRASAPSLIFLGVCDGNMEEGSLRCDANVSLRPRGARDARHQGRDQEHELVPQRPARARVRGRAPGARPWTRASGSCRRRGSGTPIAAHTRSMRSKEYAHDYRYFPEPDLVPLAARPPAGSTRSAPACPSCRAARRQRFVDASTACRPTTPRSSPRSRALADYYEAARARAPADPKIVSNWVHVRAAARAARRRRARRSPRSPDPARRIWSACCALDRGRHHQRQDRQGRLREDVAHGRGRRDHRRAARG